jgi:anaphase-promoting complex subunit 1
LVETGVQKDKYKTASYQIKEGEKINLDMTAPGATLAFGLMFFNTGHRYVSCLTFSFW